MLQSMNISSACSSEFYSIVLVSLICSYGYIQSNIQNHFNTFQELKMPTTKNVRNINTQFRNEIMEILGLQPSDPFFFN